MRRAKKRRRSGGDRRCLIVERHAWETGFAKEQLQIPLDVADQFFGPGTRRRNITVRLADAPGFSCECSISRVYRNRTRRVNGLPYLGLLGPCFVFFQEAEEAGVYDLWCEYDVAVVAARFGGWSRGRPSQYGRGRVARIVRALVRRPITTLA